MQAQAPHISVMLNEVLAALDLKGGEHVVDGTFGAGGYSRAILDQGAQVTGFDRDPNAVRDASAILDEYSGRLDLIHSPFSMIGDHLESGSLDGIVLDIGVSSMQFDQAERGFSFRFDGPLDMRMESTGLSAADAVNHLTVSDLIRVIGILGEERHAPKIAHAIDRARRVAPLKTTGDLVSVIESVVSRKAKDRIHPATRTFQGLRIFVNDELRELARALEAAELLLKPGGRLVVVTFHSLEDRLVKRFVQDRSGSGGGSRHLPAAAAKEPTFRVVGKQVIAASDDEIAVNPRSRSAKLRAATRTQAPAQTGNFEIFGLPDLPWVTHGDTAIAQG